MSVSKPNVSVKSFDFDEHLENPKKTHQNPTKHQQENKKKQTEKHSSEKSLTTLHQQPPTIGIML